MEGSQEREQVGLDGARDGVVVALVDGGEGVGAARADVVDLLYGARGEVGEAELGGLCELRVRVMWKWKGGDIRGGIFRLCRRC